MKLFILGICMILTGGIGFAILCGAAIACTYTSSSLYFVDIWNVFGVAPIAWGFLAITIIGFILSVVEILVKKK